jgi:hypothetical protein
VSEEPLGPAILISLALLLVAAAVVAAVLLVRRRRKRTPERPAAPQPTDTEKERQRSLLRDRLSELFATEVKRLEKIASGGEARYRAPWCLVLGEDQSGQGTALLHSGLHRPLPASADDVAKQAGCRFWFFDQGIALDVAPLVSGDPQLLDHMGERLKAVRPKLPLNSILLVVPADLLLCPEGEKGRAQREGLALLGERYYALVQQIQKSLLLRVPVYVLISKSDLIPGFSAFARGLGKDHQSQLFGWSCPYEPDVPYEPAWINEAFGGLYRTVSLLQLDLLSGDKLSEREREAAFLFPRHLGGLREPLRTFLDPLFKSNAYSETNVLRGFYLCGDASQQRGLLESQMEGRKFHPLFLTQLLSDKIFAESGLARPLERGLISGARALLLAKVGVAAAAVLALILLLSAQVGLSRDARAITAFLGDIPKDGASSRAATQDRDRFAKQTEQLVQDISEVAARRLARLRLPTSEFSDVDEEVRGRMRESFESVVLSGLFFGLDQKARLLFGSEASAADSPESDEPPPAGWETNKRSDQQSYRLVKPQALRDMPEYQEIVTLGKSYVDFTQHVELYNNLGTSRRKKFETVGPLVKYVFGLDLNHDLKQHQQLVEEALATASYRRFEIESVRPRAQARARALWRGLIERMFANNPLLLEAQEVQRLVTKLRSENDSGISDFRTLDELRAVLARLESDLGRPELALLNKDVLEFGEAYIEILLSLSRLSAKAELLDDLKSQYVAAFQQLRRTLIEFEVAQVGRLLLFDPEKKRLVLGPDIQQQKAVLDGLMGQAFMQPPPERPPPQGTEGSYRIICEVPPALSA